MRTYTVKLSIPADNIELTVDNSTFSMDVETPIIVQAAPTPVYDGTMCTNCRYRQGGECPSEQ